MIKDKSLCVSQTTLQRLARCEVGCKSQQLFIEANNYDVHSQKLCSQLPP